VQVELEPEMEAFLHSGCALIVGLTSERGEPFATRGWGATVLHAAGGDAPSESLQLRVLVDAAEELAVDLMGSGCAVALTAADVITLRSVQFKGRATGRAAATPADRDRADAYCDQFFADIASADLTPTELLERMRPTEVVACTVEIDEMFDQTPGPGAGGCLQGGRP
jgi:hypothetical protein